MADAVDIFNNLEALDIGATAGKALQKSKALVLKKNREQLMEGKLSTGKDITPSYLNDPYFKTREAAQRYSDWKDKITPNPNRKKGTPNLYITGPYHRSIDFNVKGLEFFFTSKFDAAAAIEKKFTGNIYWLDQENKEELLDESVEDAWQKGIEKQTGLKFT